VTDETDVEMTAQEVFARGERRIRERRANGGYPEHVNPALRDLILENKGFTGLSQPKISC
jgi:hypothetical protein